MIKTAEKRDELEINMTPMIDMVFLLIIFFLTATTFAQKEREQDVLLPSNRNAGSLSRSYDNNLIINVLRDGSAVVFGEKIAEEKLVALVKDRRLRASQPLKVLVRADWRALQVFLARESGDTYWSWGAVRDFIRSWLSRLHPAILALLLSILLCLLYVLLFRQRYGRLSLLAQCFLLALLVHLLLLVWMNSQRVQRVLLAVFEREKEYEASSGCSGRRRRTATCAGAAICTCTASPPSPSARPRPSPAIRRCASRRRGP